MRWLVVWLALLGALGCASAPNRVIPEPPETFQLDLALKGAEPVLIGAFSVWSDTFPGCPHRLGAVTEPGPRSVGVVAYDPDLGSLDAAGNVYAARWSYLHRSLYLGDPVLESPPERFAAVVLHELAHARGVEHLPGGLMAEVLPEDQPAEVDPVAYAAVCDAAPGCCTAPAQETQAP